MISSFRRGYVAASFVSMLAVPAASQQQQQQPVTTQRPPPSAQAQRVQEMLRNSGMSLDQLRKRMRAEGYSENLLDAYYSGRQTNAIPDTGVFSAVRALRLEELSDSLTRRKRAMLDKD